MLRFSVSRGVVEAAGVGGGEGKASSKLDYPCHQLRSLGFGVPKSLFFLRHQLLLVALPALSSSWPVYGGGVSRDLKGSFTGDYERRHLNDCDRYSKKKTWTEQRYVTTFLK